MPNQFFSPEGDLENYFVTEYWLIDQYIGDQLWTWGYGSTGAIGNSTTTNRSTPVTTFAGGTNWNQASSARDAAAAIKTDGTLWLWGDAALSVLGNALTTGVFSTPITTFAGGSNWKQVSLNTYYAAAIKTDGTLWTWGHGYAGKLGNGTTTNRSTPVTTFAGGTNWKQVSCGKHHTAAIKIDGTLWLWGGDYSDGELGNNSTIANISTPVTTFAGGTNWKQVSCGYDYTGAIKTDGTLWLWGDGIRGQLGNATFVDAPTPVTTFSGGTNWKQVSCSTQQTAAIKTDGTLWIWGGSSSFGALGTNDFTPNRSTPVTTFAGGTNWKQVGAGGYYTAALKTDGTLWVWGATDDGRLGNADAGISYPPTPVTTFAGGTNWKFLASGYNRIIAVEAGINAEYPLS